MLGRHNTIIPRRTETIMIRRPRLLHSFARVPDATRLGDSEMGRPVGAVLFLELRPHSPRKEPLMGTSLGFGQIVVDCSIADQLAQFWSALVERPVLAGANEFFAVIPASEDGHFPSLMFLAVPEPRQGKNRLHLDLTSTDLDGAVERAVSLGATKVGVYDEYGAIWTTLADPEGNLFDIGLPHR
jgi:hypothetical protein